MKKQVKKGYPAGSGKRWLALLMCICLIGTMLPVTAKAESKSEDTGLCEHHREHTEECGYIEGSEENSCTFVCDSCKEEAGQEESNASGEDPAVQTEEQTKEQTGKLITAWKWMDEEEYLDGETGSLSLPGATKEHPACFSDVTALLPTQIQAEVVNADGSGNPETGALEEPITLKDWVCKEYPEEGAYTGSYTFTASLPEGYALSEGAEALTVLVELGGAALFTVSYTAPSTDANGIYQISTAEELYWYAQYVNEGNASASAVLTKDISASSMQYLAAKMRQVSRWVMTR